MSRFVGVLTVVVVVVLAMGFAAVNAGHRTALSLGLLTLYRVPVTFVAFAGLLVGMLVMFAAGVVSDLKVRRILRERLAEESRKEQAWIDKSQRDLFHDAEDSDPERKMGPGRGEDGRGRALDRRLEPSSSPRAVGRPELARPQDTEGTPGPGRVRDGKELSLKQEEGSD